MEVWKEEWHNCFEWWIDCVYDGTGHTTHWKYLPGFICRKITKISQSSSRISNILPKIHILSQINLIQVFAVYSFIISFEVVLPFLYRTPKSFKTFDAFH
jgi:hypothetical protein